MTAPVVWGFAALLLLAQKVGSAFADGLDAYNRAAVAAGHAGLRAGRWLLDLLGPLGRAVRAVLAPLWRRVVALWHWLNVRLLLRMFRPLSRFGRWLVRRLTPVLTALAARVRRVVAALEPLVARLNRAIEAVERAAARIDAAWRRVWAPVLATTARWRRTPAGRV